MDPIVFIPGLLCTETLFASQIAAFSDRPIMVADHKKHDTIAGIAENVLAMAPQSFALVALSMGGYVAFEILRQAPERVSHLALLNTNARTDTPEQTKRRETLIHMAENRDFKKVPGLLYPSIVHRDRHDDALLKAIVIDMAQETGPEAFVRQTRAIINRPDARPGLGNISCPTLVVSGDGDTLMPPDLAVEMHQGIDSSTLKIIPGCGHLSTLEAPEKVTSALKEWIGSNSRHSPR